MPCFGCHTFRTDTKLPILTAVAAAIAFTASLSRANEVEITIDGLISLGSTAGMIYDRDHEYLYAGNTRNLDILHKACPVRMGEELPCEVRFKTDGGSVTEIISAATPTFGGTTINKPGAIVNSSLCDQKNEVKYTSHSGCAHFDDLALQVLAVNGDIAKLNWNKKIK